MKNILIYLIVLSIFFTLTSCDGLGDGKVIFYDMNVEFSEKLSDISTENTLPSNLASILNFTKIIDESKDCFGKYYVPKIIYNRIDLSERFEQEFPLDEGAFAFEMTITPDELNENYNINKLKVPKLLIKPSKGKAKPKRKRKNSFIVKIYDENTNNIELLKNQIEKALCEGAKSITIIVEDDEPDNSKIISQLIEEADVLFDRKEYEAAKLKYQEVLDLEANNEVVQRKVYLTVEEIKKNDKIKNLTKEADVLFAQKSYSRARDLYKGINQKYPDIKHVVGRINEINRLLQKPPKPIYKIANDGSSWLKNQNEYNSNYGKYEGGIENGKMHGQGTLVFSKVHLIPVPKHSSYKLTALNGDKLSGRFKKGNFVTGVLYDKKGKKKKTILPGE